MTAKDFLLEIGCEELPANGLFSLVTQLGDKLSQQLKQAHLEFDEIKYFATPRRLAVLVKNLSRSQPNRTIEKRGPALNAPQAAQIGFAKSCGVNLEDLFKKENYYYYITQETGQKTENLLPELVNRALSQLAGIKTMRWGNHAVLFSRPVHWVIMLYGEEEINADILGIKTSRETYGHRFHHAAKIILLDSNQYEEVLIEEGFVRADFVKRREIIRDELLRTASSISAKVIIDEVLLDEVTGLVEWPVVLLGQFPKNFLSVPKEALISSMQHHQKCFPLYDNHENLMPYFMTVSNIQSENPQVVITGNERVMRARLSDAMFFYEQDKKISLLTHVKSLEKVIFQKKLGTMADKVIRLVALSEKMADKIHVDKLNAKKAALLCKADLMTQMVNEFPELQGIMGEYYAQIQGESKEISQAIREHYLPRFAGDKLPKTALGCVVALSDRFDTLNSIFKLGETPSGDKDPFGLRRAALGIIRIIIEKELKHINLNSFSENPEVSKFILERLPAYYQEIQIPLDTLQAVLEVEQNNLYDINLRILALQNFRNLPEALALSEGNKRVKNILKKNNITEAKINIKLFELSAEKNLYAKIKDFPAETNYAEILRNLSHLREPIDQFFTDVMVEVDDQKIKQNRLLLLSLLRAIFLKIADISLLQLKGSS
jgi:glycyl-tRNA synthetase beta chain